MKATEARTPWWSEIQAIYQANNFETDPESILGSDIADHARALNCRAVIVDAGGGISTFYKSVIPHLTVNPYLKGNRDFFREACEACCDAGIRVFARNDFGHLSVALADKHPEWVAVNHDGSRRQVYDVVASCPTGGFFRDVAADAFREQLSDYPVDGVYINGLGGRCHCPRCRKLFREQTGLPWPVNENWNDRAYRRWIEWGYEVVQDLTRFQYQAVKAVRIDAPYFIDTAGLQEAEWIRNTAQDMVMQAPYQDMVSTEAFNDVAQGYTGYLGPIVGRFVRTLADAEKKRGHIFVSSFAGHSWPNTNQPAEQYRAWAGSVISAGANVITPWYGHLNDDDRRVEEPCRWAGALTEQLREYLVNAKPYAPIAVVWSRRSMDQFGRDLPYERVVHPFYGAASALLESHLPFTIISERDLSRGSDLLSRYQVLVLPNVAAMAEEEASGVASFVDNGGRCVFSATSGGLDHYGCPAAPTLLQRLGMNLEETHEVPYSEWSSSFFHCYGEVVDGSSPLFTGLDLSIIPVKGSIYRVSAGNDAERPLLEIPQSPSQPPEKGWVRPNNGNPLIIQSHGGRCTVVAFELFLLWHRFRLPSHRTLIANAVSRNLNLPYRVEAPETVEVSLATVHDAPVSDGGAQGTLLFMINHTASLLHTRPISVGPVSLTFSHPVNEVTPLTRVPARLEPGGRRIVVDRIENTEVFYLESTSLTA
jgi:hypothetical protein